MTVLITGAAGHIGSQLVREAQRAGLRPVAFVRAGGSRIGLEGTGAEVREGDLLDPGSIARAMDGVSRVIHAGAVHRNYSADPEDIVRPSVEGTRNVLAAAKRAGVSRVVHVSTGATVGFTKDPARPLDESSVLRTAKSAYIRGKIEAEQLALGVAERGDLDVVVVNPSGVFGPLDYKLTPATRAIIGLLQGDPAFLHVCITDVCDVARGTVAALSRGRTGERYLLTGEVLAPAAVAAVFGELAGVRPKVFRPPLWLARFLVGRAEKKAAREGTDAPASRDALDDLDGGQLAYDSRKSVNDLGASYRSARDTMRDTFRWLLFVDALKPKVAARVRAALGDAAAPDPAWTPVSRERPRAA